jgi:hypothetical protein
MPKGDKFRNVMAMLVLLYGSERWILTKQQISRTEIAKSRFLRVVAGYHLIDKKRK